MWKPLYIRMSPKWYQSTLTSNIRVKRTGMQLSPEIGFVVDNRDGSTWSEARQACTTAWSTAHVVYSTVHDGLVQSTPNILGTSRWLDRSTLYKKIYTLYLTKAWSEARVAYSANSNPPAEIFSSAFGRIAAPETGWSRGTWQAVALVTSDRRSTSP